LSYVIQNFYNVNQSLILNQKLYLIWIFKNIHLILTLIIKDLNTLLNINLLNNNFSIVFTLTKMFFNNSLIVLLKTLVTRWKPFLSINFTKSLQYWILTSGIEFIDNKITILHVKTPEISSNLFYNQYYLNMTVSNISLHNKYYRIVLLKFLTILLNNWQLWNKHYNITFKFLLGTKNLHLIKYYNFYFFKIYNF
jgi:hypothetical protein